jgi:hypothetical protein
LYGPLLFVLELREPFRGVVTLLQNNAYQITQTFQRKSKHALVLRHVGLVF